MLNPVEDHVSLLSRQGCQLSALDFGKTLFLERVAWIADDNLLLDGAGKGGAEYPVNMPASLGREAARLVIAPTSYSPCRICALKMRRSKFGDRQISKCRDQKIADDLVVALMGASRDLVMHRSQPTGKPLLNRHPVRIDVLVCINRPKQAAQFLFRVFPASAHCR